MYSCLENPRDGGAWWAAIYGVAHSWTWLKRLSSSSSSNVQGFWNPMDYSPPGFSVHGISQSKILEWLTISLSRASSQPKDCLLPWQADSLALNHLGFSDSSTGKESACNAGDPGSTPGFWRSTAKGIGYPLQYSWVSLVAQLVKNLPAMNETWVWSLS